MRITLDLDTVKIRSSDFNIKTPNFEDQELKVYREE